MNIQRKNLNLKHISNRMQKKLSENKMLAVRGKTITVKPFRVAVMLIAILLVLVLVLGMISIQMRKAHTVNLNLGTGGDYTMVSFQDDILLYNRQHVMAVNNKGKTLWKLDVALSHPMVETAGKYILIADLGGKNFAALYKEGKLVQEFSLGNDIISAKVNKDGDTVFATDVVGYKGNVKVFDKKGKERFSWNSGDGYIMDVAINDSGKYLAVAQLLSSTDKASSCIQFIDLSRKKIVNTAESPDTVISEIRYSNRKLLSVSESELCGFSVSGKLSYSVSFAGKKPGKYDISSDKLLVFLTSDNRGNAVLEMYTTNGRLKGQYKSENSVNNFAVCGAAVAIAEHRDVLYINSRGKLKNRFSISNDIKNIGIYGDCRTVLAVGSTTADIVRLR